MTPLHLTRPGELRWEPFDRRWRVRCHKCLKYTLFDRVVMENSDMMAEYLVHVVKYRCEEGGWACGKCDKLTPGGKKWDTATSRKQSTKTNSRRPQYSSRVTPS